MVPVQAHAQGAVNGMISRSGESKRTWNLTIGLGPS